jgi:hypothetical protein
MPIWFGCRRFTALRNKTGTQKKQRLPSAAHPRKTTGGGNRFVPRTLRDILKKL